MWLTSFLGRYGFSDFLGVHVTVAGEYWIGQVPDILAVVRPREAVDSGFESWHSGLLVTSAYGKNDCSVPQFHQSM